MPRTLILGLDGATLDLALPWSKAGHLPNLHQLMQAGSYGPLRSVMPVLSSAAWVSFMTGMNPGKHGVYDFVQRDLTTYRQYLVRGGTAIQVPSLWKLLSQAGKRVGVVNVPMTWPPEPVNGALITGLGTPDYRPLAYPAELDERLRGGGYRANKRVHYAPGREQAFLDEVYAITDLHAHAALELAAAGDWDFFMHVVRDPDEMAHFFWRYMDPSHPAHDPATAARFGSAILDYYRHIDGWVGRFVESAGPGVDVIVVSDHGSGPLYKDVMLNGWLQQMGYLHLRTSVPPAASLTQRLAQVGVNRQRISRTLRGAGLGRVERWIKDCLGDRIQILPASAREEISDRVDWSRTRAYSFGYHGQIYINLQGREAEGIVPPTAYAELCSAISDDLRSLVDPADGLPVVSAVYHKEEIFAGPALDAAPDLTVIMRDLAYITRQGYDLAGPDGALFATPHTHESGSHRELGLVIAAGPSFALLGYRADPASLMDIAPTVLHLHDLPVPATMDGSVLTDRLVAGLAERSVRAEGTADELAAAPAVPRPADAGAEDDGDAVIWEQLRGLGYVE